MPRYILERKFSQPPTDEEVDAMARRAIAANDQLGVTWVKSYYSAEEGKCYCEYEAPNAELIYQASRLAEIPLDAVHPIANVMDPEMFR